MHKYIWLDAEFKRSKHMNMSTILEWSADVTSSLLELMKNARKMAYIFDVVMCWLSEYNIRVYLTVNQFKRLYEYITIVFTERRGRVARPV